MAQTITATERTHEILRHAAFAGVLMTMAKFTWNTLTSEKAIWESLGDSLADGSTAVAGAVVSDIVHHEMIAQGMDEDSAKLIGVTSGLATKIGVRFTMDQMAKAVNESDSAVQ